MLDIQRQPGANIVQTVALVKAALPRLQGAIPSGIRLTIVTDRTETIRASVRDVQITLIMSVILVVAVIFLFLRSPRATFIPAIALPLSLIGTFGVMQQLGYALDNLSLMALTVATGFVVDDAIVMIENIVRYIEQGMNPLAAAYRGAAQIGFTIVSLTVSLIAVFIPLLFMGGVVGRLFKEFSVTLSVAVVVSAVISLTLTPMMCGRILRAARDAPPGPSGTHQRGWLQRAARRLSAQPCLDLPASDIGPADRRSDAGRHHRALYRGAERLPAAAGHRRTGRGHRGGAERLHPPAGRVADPGRADRRARSRGDRRGFVRRCRHDQRHAKHGTPDHRAEADQPTRPSAGGDRASAARDRRDSRHNRVLPAGAGHPDRHAHQPHAVPVHADGHRSGRAGAMGPAPAAQTCRRSRVEQCRHRSAERRLPHLYRCRPRRSDAARRIDAGDRGHAVRCVRPAADLHDFRPVQPVPRDAGSRSVLAG